MKRITLMLFAALMGVSAYAQGGGITPQMLQTISGSYQNNATDKALRNALNTTSINVLSTNAQNASMIDTNFSDRVQSKGISNQKQSGRCWLFTGLNVLRAQAMSNKPEIGEFFFSQNYCFFYDQLEKANLFLQGIIDTREKPIDDREVDWLLSNPIGDGGTFTGVANLVMKYGVVPANVMPESLAANSTSAMSAQLKTLLRQDALRLRDVKIKAKSKADQARFLQDMKTQMLCDVYRILALCLGVPPQQFEYNDKTYTPVEFYNELVGIDMNTEYVMLMNDPCREYYKLYEIQYDRHLYDGDNWLYLNLPIQCIKQMATASIKAGKAMYFSCDVNKFLNRNNGVADLANFDYESLLGVQFTMDKRERILTHASGSSHAMTLVAVDVKDGEYKKWMVENSWGRDFGYKGHIIMTDEWFNEYMFRLVVEKQFIPAELMPYLDQKPVQLPAWDPMFMGEE